MEKKQLGIFNLSIFLFFSCFNQIQHYSRILNRDLFQFHNGFTFIWLLILYFLGSYFGRFYSESHKYYKIITFIVCFAVIHFAAHYRNIILINKIKINDKQAYSMRYEYPAPSMVIIATCVIIVCSKLEINFIVFQKIISFFAPLTYGVYLIHNHVIVRDKIIANNYSWLLKYHSYELIYREMYESLKIFIYCSLIDFVRLLLFKIFRIRQICTLISSLIEKLLYSIIFLFEFLY